VAKHVVCFSVGLIPFKFSKVPPFSHLKIPFELKVDDVELTARGGVGLAQSTKQNVKSCYNLPLNVDCTRISLRTICILQQKYQVYILIRGRIHEQPKRLVILI